MMYKMELGRLMELNGTFDATNAEELHKEDNVLGSLVVLRQGTDILFRCRVFDRPLSLLARTNLETAESVRYLRSIGFFDVV